MAWSKIFVSSLSLTWIQTLSLGYRIGVIRGDQQTLTVHLGDAGYGNPPNDDTVYEIGSVSKVFTGLLLADAVNQATVQLEQPAQELLPDGVTMPKGKERGITLLDLSTHASGLPRISNNMPDLESENPYENYSSKLAYEFLNEHKLEREPGSKREYSNFAVSLLGHLLCAKAGKSFDELLEQQITSPLGMKNTRVELSDSMQKHLAKPFLSKGHPTTNWTFADMPGAGGIRSNTTDMLKFVRANLQPPENEIGKTLKLAFKKHRAGQGNDFSMGLGWNLARDGSTRWHNGQTAGYHSMLMVNQKLKVALILMTNTGTMEVDQLAEQIIMLLMGKFPKPRKFEDAKEVAEEIMQRYVGRYELAPGFMLTVSLKDGELMVGATNQPTLQVFAKSETEWFYKAVDASLSFELNADNECTAVVLNQNGVKATAKKK